MIGIKTLVQLGKAASGDMTPEAALELLSSLGIETRLEGVPEERKADAFQQVAQFSLQPASNVVRLTMISRDGSRMEGLVVLRMSDQSGNDPSKKILDRETKPSLSLCQST